MTLPTDTANAAPAHPAVEVRLRGDEVLLLCGSNALVSPMSVTDRALVAGALGHALAMTLNALATDIAVLAEPAGNA